MQTKRIIILSIFLSLCCFGLQAQYVPNAESLCDSLSTALATAPEKEKATIYNALTKIHINMHDTTAFQYADSAYKYALKHKDRFNEEKVLYYFGLAYSNLLKESAIALEYHRKALVIAEEIEEVKYRAGIHLAISNVYHKTGNYPEALENSLEAYEIAKQLGKEKYILFTLIGVGQIYTSCNQHRNALEYIDEALEKSIALNDKFSMARCKLYLGNIYFEMKKHEKALRYLIQAENVFEKLNDKHRLVRTMQSIGNVYLGKQNYTKALEYYSNTLSISQEINEDKIKIAALSNIGNVYYYLEEYQKALEYQFMAIDGFKMIQKKVFFDPLNVPISKRIYQNYQALNMPEKALFYYKNHIQLKDSVYNVENMAQVSLMKMHYKIEKKEKDIVLLAQKVKIQRYIRNVSIAGLCIAIIIFLLLYNRLKLKRMYLRNQQEHLEEELILQENKLAVITLNILQKNETLEELVEKIDGLLPFVNDNEIKRKLEMLSRDVNRDIDPKKNWEVFKLHFEQAHPRFLENLQKQHPSLSDNDIRICTYIKTKLSSKEIARLLNITEASLRKSRYRIKKKMILPTEMDLAEFIASFV